MVGTSSINTMLIGDYFPELEEDLRKIEDLIRMLSLN
jgi:hypothetical protein